MEDQRFSCLLQTGLDHTWLSWSEDAWLPYWQHRNMAQIHTQWCIHKQEKTSSEEHVIPALKDHTCFSEVLSVNQAVSDSAKFGSSFCSHWYAFYTHTSYLQGEIIFSSTNFWKQFFFFFKSCFLLKTTWWWKKAQNRVWMSLSKSVNPVLSRITKKPKNFRNRKMILMLLAIKEKRYSWNVHICMYNFLNKWSKYYLYRNHIVSQE